MSVYGYKDVCGVVVSGGLTGPPYVKLLVCQIYILIHFFDRHKVHKFFTHPAFPSFTDNSNATKIHQAYSIFVRALTYQYVIRHFFVFQTSIDSPRPLSWEWTLHLYSMLSETMTTTRTWIFKCQKDWRVYMEKASQITPKLVIFGEKDRMNSPDFIDYIKVS